MQPETSVHIEQFPESSAHVVQMFDLLNIPEVQLFEQKPVVAVVKVNKFPAVQEVQLFAAREHE